MMELIIIASNDNEVTSAMTSVSPERRLAMRVVMVVTVVTVLSLISRGDLTCDQCMTGSGSLYSAALYSAPAPEQP